MALKIRMVKPILGNVFRDFRQCGGRDCALTIEVGKEELVENEHFAELEQDFPGVFVAVNAIDPESKVMITSISAAPVAVVRRGRPPKNGDK